MARVNVGHSSRSQRSLKRAAAASLALLLVASALLLAWTRVQAGGVVTGCSNDVDLSSKLAGGGAVTFSCGPNPVTIILSSAKTISADTTIDGGGLITLSGGNSHRLFLVNAGATLTLNNITLTNGYAGGGPGPYPTQGGAILNNGGALHLNNTTVRNSQSTFAAGAIEDVNGTTTLTDSLIENNQSNYGGGIDSIGNLTLINTIVRGNHATGHWGGGLDVGGMVTISNSQINNNIAVPGVGVSDAVPDGGGIYNSGTMTLTDVTLSGNNAVSEGGGIYNSGTVTLTDVTLNGNSTGNGNGGGIYNTGTVTLTNVTLSANSASNGGGIFNTGAASLVNVTLASSSANGATNVSGIVSDSSSTQLNLKNVVVADSAMGVNCYFGKAPDSSLFNLSSDGTCNFGAGRDSILDMKLGPLADNGGPTLTHMPQPGSPAIDNGTGAGCPATDQRGAPRPVGAACDVGAVEYGSTPPTPIPSPSPTPSPTHSASPTPSPSPTPSATPEVHHKQGDLNCSGSVDGADALRSVRAAAGLAMTPPSGCPALDSRSPQFGDVNCDGALDVKDTVAILQFTATVAIRPTPLPGCTPIGQALS
jgi:hypothetical protein